MTDDTPFWHNDRKISIANLLTTLVLIGTVFSWASGVNERIAIIETASRGGELQGNLAHQLLNERIDAQALRASGEMSAMRGRFDRLDAYLARIENKIEGRNDGRPER